MFGSAVLAVVLALVLPAAAQSPPPTGCSAMAGSSCQFVPVTASPGGQGYISGTPGRFSITTVNTVPLGQANPCTIAPAAGDTGTLQTTAASTTTTTTYTVTYANTGPGAGTLVYTLNCLYTLVVDATTGNIGLVLAGATN